MRLRCRFSLLGWRVSVLWRGEASPFDIRRSLSIPSVEHAKSLLWMLAEDGDQLTALRWATCQYAMFDGWELCDAELVDALAEHLLVGDLLICPFSERRPQGPPGIKPRPHVPPKITPHIPPGKKQDLHWIEVQVLDLAGRPIPGISYELELPDGSIRSGTLDDNGSLDLQDIPTAGTCKLALIDIGDDEWQFGFYEP